MDRRTFYNAIRSDRTLFAGSLTQSQVDGIEALLDEGLERNLDRRWIAYTLGTTFHEVARTMQPIEEYGRGRGRPYGVPDPVTGKTYYGRGFVQLTWKRNYKLLGDKLGVDLVNRPELALDLKNATQIIYIGMIEGLFSGRRHKFSDFFTPQRSDWYNARRMVNLLDRAQLVQTYALAFYRAILRATEADRVSDLRMSEPMREPMSEDGQETMVEEDYIQIEKEALLSSDASF